MKDRARIYFHAIIGAIGGLTGWLLANLLIHSDRNGRLEFVQQIIYGAILGAFIGLGTAAYEGIGSRALRRFIKFGGIGFGLGAVAGAVALPLAYKLYAFLGVGGSIATLRQHPFAAISAGIACWLIFGAIIGLAEGAGKGTQAWKGCLGGTLGGVSGGLIYELNRVAGDWKDAYWQQLFLAISLLLLGAAISAAIALVVSALKQAWFEVLNGKLAGRLLDVTKYADPKLGAVRSGIIGSDQWSANIFLPGDSDVFPNHAEINYENGAPTLKLSGLAGKKGVAMVNGRRIMSTCPLADGDRLQIGATQLVFHHKRA